MTKSLKEIGERLIQEAERILLRDVKGALSAKDYNLVVRRAQEVVELVLKGGLKILGVEYPKVHDVALVFSEQVQQKLFGFDKKVLDRIEEISLWLTQARSPSFYFERDYEKEDARRAAEDASYVLKEVRDILRVKA
jgi:HEPN domain-containing protein